MHYVSLYNINVFRSTVRASQQQQAASVHQQQTVVQVTAELVPSLETLEVVTEEGVASTWQPDPNEPRYCICNDVSYGDMVGCDNEDVSEHTELFSFTLMGITIVYFTHQPVGRCNALMSCYWSLIDIVLVIS